MPTEKKQIIAAELATKLAQCSIALATDYRGLSVAEITQLRRRLGAEGVEYRVVKNTLARLAATAAGKPGLVNLLDGPTAIALGYGDIIAPSRVIADYLRSTRKTMDIRGAVIARRVLGSEEVSALATLPPREVLLSRVLGGIQSPLYSLANVLNANLRGLFTVLQGRIHQLEGD
ncbi:MAG: 50S ribosomal protein L10 [Chloroflexi bacterium]|nr:50S ribosomal protein L10 [Chloroflexota bacterium]